MKTLGALGLSVALLCGGLACSKDKKESAHEVSPERKAAAARLVAPPFLERIPADAAFVFANYEAVDPALIDGMAKFMEPLTKHFREKLNSESPEGAAFFEEFGDLLSVEGLEKLGLKTTPFVAFYSHDASMVMRLELADGDALLAFVDKLIERYDEDKELGSKTLGSMRYWESSKSEPAMVLGVDKSQLVLAVMPKSQKEALLPYVLGDKRPKKSLADSGSLAEVVAQYGGAKGAGYFDSRKLVATLVGDTPWLAGTEFDLSGKSSVCKKEFAELAGVMPKLVFGFDRLDTEEVSFYYGLELRSDIAKKVSSVVRPVPGYDYLKKSDALMSFGMGANVGGMLSWGKELAAKIDKSPYQCEDLLPLNEAFEGIARGAGMAPPVISDIEGIVMVLTHFDPADKQSIRGMAAVQSKEPGPLLSILTGLVPPLATLKLEEGARPTKVDTAALGVPFDVYASRSKRMLGAAIGEAQGELNTLITSETPKEGAFMSMRFDYGLAMQMGMFDDEEPMSEESELMMKKLMASFGALVFEMKSNDLGVFMRYAQQLR